MAKQFIFLFMVSIFLIPNSINARNPFKGLFKKQPESAQTFNEVPNLDLLNEQIEEEINVTPSELEALKGEITRIKLNDEQKSQLLQVLERNKKINESEKLLLKTIILGNIATAAITILLILKNLALI